MQNLILVALGGAIGAIARYGVGWAAGRLLGTAFPWGTFIVNLVGCFLMGIVGQLLLDWEPARVLGNAALDRRGSISLLRHAVAIGFLGGLTTFSAFGWDTFRELDSGRPSMAFANVAANGLAGLAAVWCGVLVVRSAA